MRVPVLLRRSLLLVSVPVLLVAQPDRSRDRGEGRVILYADADFRGSSIVLYPGDRIEDFARQRFDDGDATNDRVSSIRCEGRVELVLHADGNFRGDALRLRDSISNLADLEGPSRRGDWNDIISSATVNATGGRERRRWRGGQGRGDVRGPRVELYSDANYDGPVLVLVPGDRAGNLADVGMSDDDDANDRISSIRVTGGAAAIVHADADFRGASLRVEESVPNLALRSEGGRAWNDRISSIAVTLDRGPAPEAIIGRVYRELLGREPDAEMLAHYARAMREQGYTEAELRTEIRRSREYRERDAQTAVRRAYRDVLKRDPDEQGFAHYVRMMVDQGWSEGRVREELRNSEEFRNRG